MLAPLMLMNTQDSQTIYDGKRTYLLQTAAWIYIAL